MKIAPPMRATRTMARGTVRSALWVSSVSVLTASKPRKEYAATAAPAASAENPPSPVKGRTETSDCASPTRWVIVITTKMTRIKSWKAISTKFVRSATLRPMTLSAEVMTMKPTIHTQTGTAGNWPFRYAPPISQITSGRNR